jgi:predicted acetyltransferase
MAPTTSPLTLRSLDPDDATTLDSFLTQTATVFTAPFRHTPQRREALRPKLHGQRLAGMFDGDRLVGTYRSWDWNVTVPGGSAVRADAVSSVTVLPTHRRRGVLRGLILPDLADAHARGVPLAVLIASEAPIYGRFGFGPAVETATWEVDLAKARLAPEVPRAGSVEMVPLRDLRDVAPRLFEAARRPGATDRSAHWWDVECQITPIPGEDPEPRAGVVHRATDGTATGYLIYGWKDDWPDRVCRTVASVRDLQATTAEAYAALWGFLLGLDLVARVRADDRPVDEALPWLLTDPRAARRTATCDLLWVRVLDPVAALAARRYESAGHVVLELTDPQGYATGRFALDVDGDGVGRAVPTGADPDLTLGVDVLGSLYLGAGDLSAAAAAGRVVQHRAGGVARVARLLRTTRAPWTGTWF